MRSYAAADLPSHNDQKTLSEAAMPNTAHIYKSKNRQLQHQLPSPDRPRRHHRKENPSQSEDHDSERGYRVSGRWNESLAIADESPSRLPTRSNAAADGKYARVVIDTFSRLHDAGAGRLSLDPRAANAFAAPRCQGRQGPLRAVRRRNWVGKSRLIQHLLQTTSYNSPTRGAGRITVSNTEVIVDDVDYSAAITFFTENEIRQIVRENIVEACAFAYQQGDDKANIVLKLLVDTDKRFRFNYVLGGWPQKIEASHEEENDADEQEADFDLSVASAERLDEAGAYRIDEVLLITEAALARAGVELQTNSPRDEAQSTTTDEYIAHDELKL